MYLNQVKFGCRLRNLRKQRRMTQEALAGSLNISIDHLSKIEHGKRGVSIDLLLDISEALDVSRLSAERDDTHLASDEGSDWTDAGTPRPNGGNL